MPGLWEAWKAKGRLPTLPTSPLEISPTAGEIPTFPTSAGKACWKSGKPKAGFPLSHRPESSFSKQKKNGGGLRPPSAKRAPFGHRLLRGKINERRHRAAATFQAHPALESKRRFRLIAHWNQFWISGSFVDWKMLRPQGEPSDSVTYRLAGGSRLIRNKFRHARESAGVVNRSARVERVDRGGFVVAITGRRE
jgi:hypothetical protein